jgi:hypothetical protein
MINLSIIISIIGFAIIWKLDELISIQKQIRDLHLGHQLALININSRLRIIIENTNPIIIKKKVKK